MYKLSEMILMFLGCDEILTSSDVPSSGIQQHDVIIYTHKGVDEQLIITAF